MHVEDLNYAHPPELVAQTPCEPRDAARLLTIGRNAGEKSDHHVRDLRSLLAKGDLLVLNTTKVIPARLKGHKESGGQVEILLIHPLEPLAVDEGESWNCMVRGKVRQGTKLILQGGTQPITASIDAIGQDAHRTVRFQAGIDVLDFAMSYGAVPLPPYIRRDADEYDEARYQSVFAQQPGSVAAPTASLHFTPELLSDLEDMGVRQAHVELRVGPGTFKPVEHERVEDHPIHHEWCHCSAETIEAIARARKEGGRVIAVGTTVVRTLESAWENEIPQPFSGWTARFLYPPQVIRGCDYLLTNFHLPKSTLLALVACFIGRDELLGNYHYAIEQKYRLFSYGDAMLVPNRFIE